MLSEINPIFLLIIAGLINGSFVIPSKYMKNANNDQIWLSHTIVGLAIIPWIMIFFITPKALQNYMALPSELLLFIAASGIIFGFGQIWFSKAIQILGVALSFAINLGIGLIIGSMFVIFYESAFLTEKGVLATLAVFLILFSLIIYYFSGKTNKPHENLNDDYKHNHTKGWILASLTGVTSGLQNITFVMVIFHSKIQIQTNDFFWVWPPFLLAAAIPMFFGFRQKIKNNLIFNKSIVSFLSVKNLILIILMGLFFTGSLALYSIAMGQLNDHEKIIGWPAFMLSIIFASQIWGILYKEAAINAFKNKLYRFLSLSFLIVAIVILSLKT